MIEEIQIVQPIVVKMMQNSKERDEESDRIGLDYFERWKKPCGKTERIYVRVTPEIKTEISTSSEKVGLSLSDFVVGASLEAAKFISDGDN